ncbi:alpha/beta hydrolase [Algoriphagus sp. CAU 1675]|uniref:alpha/beta hydrolase n=1 Tax=Algoriphagus sp. CAU 1675 TaxID=3032597 RepID=UPI0023DC1DEA|nr:alpha/beta hydrolase [Algoriphagus sp. CAU 1675]MDF2158572.1 alpha/beta hydrolase [Algoriphagus sp. CAU 1675]
MTFKHLLIAAFVVLLFQNCAVKRVERTKEVPYVSSTNEFGFPEKRLNIFAPQKAVNLPVLIFIHGGSWEHGKKEVYDYLGNRLARRGVVTVIVDYPLAPDFQVKAMEEATLRAVVWTKKNIQAYGGDPEQIFLAGHSAGGHLAALATVKDELYQKAGVPNPLQGTILIDPAGLDMYGYLEETKNGEGKKYLPVFTEDPQVWKDASPIYFLEKEEVPMLILEGERTYPAIREGRKRFVQEAEQQHLDVELKIYPKKKHIPMITQFFWTGSQAYRDVLDFMERVVRE